MNQDLMEWLKADSEKISSRGGLLLVPVNPDSRKFIDVPALEPKIKDFLIKTVNADDEIENKNQNEQFKIFDAELNSNFGNENEIENPAQDSKIENQNLNVSESESESNFESENENSHENFKTFDAELNSNFENENEIKNHAQDLKIENQNLNVSESESESNFESENENSETINDFSSKISELNQSLQEIEKLFSETPNREESKNEIEAEAENEIEENEEIDEKATGFELNLNEPPPELWTKINFDPSEAENFNDDEDEELDYEQGMSLQGAAYVPKAPKGAPARGQNFTERLQQSMRGRKQRAEKRREEEAEKTPKHPYRSKAVIICSTLLMLLGLAFLTLWFIRQWTPEKIQQRAVESFKIGDYEGAMSLFQRGYKHYPKELNFLAGIAKTAEKSGQTQTAITAWESYINLLPKNDKNRKFAELELKRLKGEPESTKKIQVSAPKPKRQPKKTETKIISEEPKLKKQAEIKNEKTETIKINSESGAKIPEEQLEGKKEIKKQEIKTEKKSEKKPPAAYYEVLNGGNEAYNLKNYDRAVIYFQCAIKLNGSDARAYVGLAGAYQAKGMLFDAKRILYEAKQKCGKNSTVDASLKILEGK